MSDRSRRGGIGLALLAGLALTLAVALPLAGCAAGASATPQPTLAAGQIMLPTATPIPTPADPAGQALLRAAREAVGASVRSVGLTYDRTAQQATAMILIDGIVPDTNDQIAAAYARVKTLTLQVEDALWASGQPLRQAQVIIMGPAQDEYGEVTDQWYGIAVLNAPAARRIAWASVTPESGWKLYDQTYLRPSFTVADDIITGPVPTATPG